MDLSGRIVIPARFEFAHYFRGSEAVVKDGGRWGIIDRSGQYVLPPRYERLQGAGFSEGLCGVRLGGLWGFMDRSGQMIIKPQFIGVEEFSDGAAGFLFNSAYGTQTYKYGYIDRNGQTLFPPGMTAIGPFRNGRAWQVSSICSGMQAIIDKKKQPFFPDADHGTLCRMTPRTWTFSGNGPGMVVVDSTTGNQIFRIDEPVELLIPVTETIYFVLYLDSHDRVEYGYLDTRRGVIRRFVVTNREDIRRVRSM